MDSKKLKAKRTIYKHRGLINQVFHMGIEINSSQNQYICLLEYVNKWIKIMGAECLFIRVGGYRQVTSRG